MQKNTEGKGNVKCISSSRKFSSLQQENVFNEQPLIMDIGGLIIKKLTLNLMAVLSDIGGT